MSPTKDFLIRLALFIALTPLIIGIVAGGYFLAVVAGAVLGITIILKSSYNILFK